MWDYVTEDVLILILKRLPVETLLRCRCVSKSWNQLISSKPFILDHLSLQTPGIAIQNHDLRYHLFHPQTLPSFRTLEAPISIDQVNAPGIRYTFSSHHGVNCVYTFYGADTLIVLFNPSTRQLLTIPPPEPSIFRSSNDHLKYCGFWIDPSTNNFKVVIFCLETKGALLFSSSKGKVWMGVEMGDIGGCRASYRSPQVMIDGVAHWIARNEDMSEPGNVVWFDFGQNKFGAFELPRGGPSLAVGLQFLCKWQDSLSVVHCDDFVDDTYCDVWLMQNGSWSEMVRFELPQGIIWVYCVLESSGRVLTATRGDILGLYDPKDGFIPLDIESGRRSLSFSFSYDFVESLVFPG